MISPLTHARVLVVEDETLLALDFEATLQEGGCTVVGPVASVAAAIGAIEDQSPDAALLDMNLNGESSAPVADLLADRGIPFVIVTGYDRHHLPARHRDAPIVGKPYRPKLLLEVLEQTLSRQSPAID